MNNLFEGIEDRLKIVETNALHGHEETIHHNLIKLKEAMLNFGQLVDPLIVDRKTMVVLDGNHRITVLEMIKCPRAVCQFVDYSDSAIKVGTWFPVSEDLDAEKVKKAGLRCDEVEKEEGLKALAEKKACFMLSKKTSQGMKNWLIEYGDYTLDGLVEAQKRIISKFGEERFAFAPDDEAEQFVAEGKCVLYRKIYTKQEIVDYALCGKKFPPKSTRHVIPNRIIRLNMRLGWLHEGKKEAEAYLHRMLKERIYNGNVRRYSEPVIVIY